MNTKSENKYSMHDASNSPKGKRSQKKIYLRTEEQFIDVSAETYYAYYQPIWRIRKNAQRKGRCACTEANLWQCDGDCCDCMFCTSSQTGEISIESAVQDNDELSLEDLFASDDLNPENIVIKNELISALRREVQAMKPLDKRIIHYLLVGKTENEIALLLSKSQPTISYHRKKIAAYLKAQLKDYLPD